MKLVAFNKIMQGAYQKAGINAIDADIGHAEEDVGFLDISCMKLQSTKVISSLILACRFEHTLGVLANGRVFARDRRCLPAITATSLRRHFFKWLHAQPQECQDRLDQPQ